MAGMVLSGLSKSFGPTRAVEGFDLTVGEGEFVALLGPSGCGKTTVMRMIAGITPPDGGRIEIGGRIMDMAPPEKRNIGLVFQSYALFPHMTVEANVGFGLRMRGVPQGERTKRVTDALELVSLQGLGGRYPRELSGGQQQRVAVARAVVIAPDILLFDEPLSNLDAKLREGLREELSALQRRLGVTSLYVTHDQEEAMALADRIVVMNAGRIVEIGAPVDLYRRPRTRFAASFLGHSNMVPLRREGAVTLLPWGERVEVPLEAVELCIRPEDVGITH
ncbi:MAG: ABC transporter ATP-binding protein, partial [Beijerinckiaceae bacterium]